MNSTRRHNTASAHPRSPGPPIQIRYRHRSTCCGSAPRRLYEDHDQVARIHIRPVVNTRAHNEGGARPEHRQNLKTKTCAMRPQQWARAAQNACACIRAFMQCPRCTYCGPRMCVITLMTCSHHCYPCVHSTAFALRCRRSSSYTCSRHAHAQI